MVLNNVCVLLMHTKQYIFVGYHIKVNFGTSQIHFTIIIHYGPDTLQISPCKKQTKFYQIYLPQLFHKKQPSFHW